MSCELASFRTEEEHACSQTKMRELRLRQAFGT